MQELLKIIQGDAVSGLKTISDKSAHCTITSSPYFGLRSYGSPPINWPEIRFKPMAGLPELVIPAMEACLGNEDTPEAFVGHLVENAREVWRVLRDDGIYWLNLGDSYARAGGTDKKQPPTSVVGNTQNTLLQMPSRKQSVADGLKQKDLVGIPWRVALALQADGWYLRQDIIWQKNNPMPESVTDRCTKSHEHIFMLTKSPKYFFDNEAIKEPLAESSIPRAGRKQKLMDRTGLGTIGKQVENGIDSTHSYAGLALGRNGKTGYNLEAGTRNKRDVWQVNTKPFRGAHFAVFPPKLIEPMILAGTSEKGCCPQCGAQWTRIVESKPATSVACPKTQEAHEARGGVGEPSSTVGKSGSGRIQGYSRTVGWEQGCKCENNIPVPCTVLDQFFGSGTTGMVALGLGRRAIGVELNPDYIKIAKQRCSDENVKKEITQMRKIKISSPRKEKPVSVGQLSLQI
jgi:DNA modification methylase